LPLLPQLAETCYDLRFTTSDLQHSLPPSYALPTTHCFSTTYSACYNELLPHHFRVINCRRDLPLAAECRAHAHRSCNPDQVPQPPAHAPAPALAGMDLDFDDVGEQRATATVKQEPRETVKKEPRVSTPVKREKPEKGNETPEKGKDKSKESEDVQRLWGNSGSDWKAALPMVQKTWRVDPAKIPHHKQAFVGGSWLQMVEVEGNSRLICTPCSGDGGKECFINPKLCNLKRHHRTRRHAEKTKGFLGVEVGPTGTGWILEQIPPRT